MFKVFITNFVHLPMAMLPLYAATGTFPQTSAFNEGPASWSWNDSTSTHEDDHHHYSYSHSSSSSSQGPSPLLPNPHLVNLVEQAASSSVIRNVNVLASSFDTSPVTSDVSQVASSSALKTKQMKEAWHNALHVVDATARGI
ncbi:hypothetical protein BC829DRAFT_398 [Chytridium lagenaria]|nr:hypothetical protein BC829DRAFT_398 [Chytridium lagenaria]